MSNIKNTDNIVDLDLQVTARTCIRINGDNDKVVKLNLSDIGIITRLNDAYPKLEDLQAEVTKVASAELSEDSDEQLKEMSLKFKEINQSMKDLVDFIFDYPVSDICCDGGSMYDPFNGQYRFEYIIEKLSALYNNNLTEEFKRMQKKVEVHTTKYTNKRKKK